MGLLLSSSDPIVQGTLARLPDAEVMIAAYSVSIAIVLLIDSPSHAMLHMGNALVHHAQSHRLAGYYALTVVVLLSLLVALVGWTPLFDLIFRDMLGLPAAVVSAAQPIVRMFWIWPLTLGLRRFYQGVLIHAGYSLLLTIASVIRLLFLLVGATLTVRYAGQDGMLWSALLITAAQALEMLIIVAMAWLLIRRGWIRLPKADQATPPLTLNQLNHFFIPLAATQIILWLGQALISAAVARGAEPKLALSAWPVAYGLMVYFITTCQMLQQIVIARAEPGDAASRVRRFVLIAGGLITVTLLGLLWIGGIRHYLEVSLAMPVPVVDLALTSITVMAGLPLAFSLQQWYQGVLIRERRTRAIRTGTLLHVTLLIVITFALVSTTNLSGSIAAAIGLCSALLTELWFLHRVVRSPTPRGVVEQ